MILPMKLTRLVCCVGLASTLVACGPSLKTAALKNDLQLSARRIVGTSLIGVKGETELDQDRIDDTVAGLCGAGIWTASECARHKQR